MGVIENSTILGTSDTNVTIQDSIVLTAMHFPRTVALRLYRTWFNSIAIDSTDGI